MKRLTQSAKTTQTLMRWNNKINQLIMHKAESEKFLVCFFQKAKGISFSEKCTRNLTASLVEGFRRNRLAKLAETSQEFTKFTKTKFK